MSYDTNCVLWEIVTGQLCSISDIKCDNWRVEIRKKLCMDKAGYFFKNNNKNNFYLHFILIWTHKIL